MKILSFAAVLCVIALAVVASAHHPAASIVDEEIYEMIDSMVADTPHGDMVFDTMGSTTMIEITGRITDMQQLVDADLLSYLALLDGDVSLNITFTSPRALTMTIEQVEDPLDADKAAPAETTFGFGEVKEMFR